MVLVARLDIHTLILLLPPIFAFAVRTHEPLYFLKLLSLILIRKYLVSNLNQHFAASRIYLTRPRILFLEALLAPLGHSE